LTLGCLVFELVLVASVFLFAAAFVPGIFMHELGHAWIGLWNHNPRLFVTLITAAAYGAMSVIEPFYIAAGFGLYLTRRTQLEAWDIDLAFRCLRRRWETIGCIALLCASLSALSVSGLIWPGQCHAAVAKTPADISTSASIPASASTSASSVRVEQIFNQPATDEDKQFTAAARWAYGDPRLGGQGQHREWVLRHPSKVSPEPPKPASSALSSSPSAPTALMKGLAWIAGIGMKLLLLGGLLVALGVLVWFVMRQGWQIRLPASKRRAQIPLAAMQHILVADALPDDLGAAARRLWQGGQQREALAMLYRGCVKQVAADLDAPMPAHATEADCLRQADLLTDDLHRQRAVNIVHAWQYAAYAGRFPDEGEVNTLLTGWPSQQAGAA
jgi:predicted lipid-binding transport protein (Tim44 family)